METVELYKCKYSSHGDDCHYWQQIKVFDDNKVRTYSICTYLGGKCLCSDEEEEE